MIMHHRKGKRIVRFKPFFWWSKLAGLSSSPSSCRPFCPFHFSRPRLALPYLRLCLSRTSREKWRRGSCRWLWHLPHAFPWPGWRDRWTLLAHWGRSWHWSHRSACWTPWQELLPTRSESSFPQLDRICCPREPSQWSRSCPEYAAQIGEPSVSYSQSCLLRCNRTQRLHSRPYWSIAWSWSWSVPGRPCPTSEAWCFSHRAGYAWSWNRYPLWWCSLRRIYCPKISVGGRSCRPKSRPEWSARSSYRTKPSLRLHQQLLCWRLEQRISYYIYYIEVSQF